MAENTDWLTFLNIQVAWNNGLLPKESFLNFVSPLIATDSPNTNSIDIALDQTKLLFYQYSAPITSNTVIPSNLYTNISVPYSTIGNVITASFQPDAIDGSTVTFIDTGFFSATNNLTIQDYNSGSVLVQDPDTYTLGTTYVVTSVRNLTFRKVTDPDNGTFWAAI